MDCSESTLVDRLEDMKMRMYEKKRTIGTSLSLAGKVPGLWNMASSIRSESKPGPVAGTSHSVDSACMAGRKGPWDLLSGTRGGI